MIKFIAIIILLSHSQYCFSNRIPAPVYSKNEIESFSKETIKLVDDLMPKMVKAVAECNSVEAKSIAKKANIFLYKKWRYPANLREFPSNSSCKKIISHVTSLRMIIRKPYIPKRIEQIFGNFNSQYNICENASFIGRGDAPKAEWEGWPQQFGLMPKACSIRTPDPVYSKNEIKSFSKETIRLVDDLMPKMVKAVSECNSVEAESIATKAKDFLYKKWKYPANLRDFPSNSSCRLIISDVMALRMIIKKSYEPKRIEQFFGSFNSKYNICENASFIGRDEAPNAEWEGWPQQFGLMPESCGVFKRFLGLIKHFIK